MKINPKNSHGRIRISEARRAKERFSHAIFKAYDIRGIYPDELNKEAAYFIGRAFTQFLANQKLRSQKSLLRQGFGGQAKVKIVVGRDARVSTPVLFRNLVRGITDEGGDVIDIGLAITPMLYFAVAHFKFDGGISITASHNPPQYNGFKMVREGAIPVSGESGIKDIQEIIEKGKWTKKKKGKVFKKKILSEYIKFNLKGFDFSKTRSFKIVIDTANAVPGVVAPKIFKKTRCKIYHLYSELDGTFPNHLPDPNEKENLKGLQKMVKNKKADLGIAFDGDGDRVIFVDEKGRLISGDLISALVATRLLEENPGEKMLCDVRSSMLVKEAIEEAGGKALMGRVGHSFIKERMRKDNILFQGERNGHYYLRSHYFSDAPFFVIFKVLEEMGESKKSIFEIVKPFQKYFYSGEMNFEVEDKEAKIRKLKNRYRSGKVLTIDGLRVDYEDWWFIVRPSNTEPVLRLVVEAKSKELMEEKKKELKKLIAQ